LEVELGVVVERKFGVLSPQLVGGSDGELTISSLLGNLHEALESIGLSRVVVTVVEEEIGYKRKRDFVSFDRKRAAREFRKGLPRVAEASPSQREWASRPN